MNLSDLVIVVRASTKDFERGMMKTRAEIAKTQNTAGRLNNVGGAMAGLGKAATLGVTLPVVAAAAVSVKLAASFETTMNQVQAAGKVGAGAMEEMRQYALKMGADTMFSAGEAGQAMLELVKGGMSAAEVKAGGLKAALDLAAAGDLDLAYAANTTVKAMGMFGLGADKAGQIAAALAGGANASTASVEDMAMALSQVGPGATNAGLSLQDTVGVLASFANKGIMGSDAGTSLKTMLTRLVPTTDTAAKAMEKYGLSFVDAKGNIDPITVVAQKLQDKLGTLSQAERTRAMSQIFGSDATRAATVLMQEGADGITKYITATSNQNAATDMAKARTKGLAGMWEQLKGSLETIAIVIGTVLIPPLTGLTKWLTGVLNKFLALDKGTQKTLLILAGIAALIGPLLILFGKMAQGMAAVINVTKAFGKTPGAISKIASAAKGATGAIGRFVQRFKDARVAESAFSGKAGSLGGAFKKMLSKEKWGSMGSSLKGFATSFANGVADALKSGSGKLKTVLQGAVSKSASGMKVAVSAVASAAASAGGMVKDTAATIANTAAKLANAVATKVVAAAQWLWNAALAANPIGLIIVGIVALVAIFIVLWKRCEWFRNFWKGLWAAIKPALTAIWNGIKAAWAKVVEVTREVWAVIGPYVRKVIQFIVADIRLRIRIAVAVLRAAWAVIQRVTKVVWPVIVAIVRNAMNGIRVAVAVIRVVVGIVRAAWNAARAVTRALWNAITFVVRQYVNRIRAAVAVVNRVVAIFRRVWGLVRSVTAGLWEGIKRAVGAAVEWIVSKITWVWDKLKGAAKAIGGLFGGGEGARGGRGGMGPRGRFASGGYIPATRGGRMVLAGEGGEGEWIVPASKKRQFAAENGGGRGGVNVSISIGQVHGTDRATARKLASMVSEELMRGVGRQMVGQNA